MKQHIADPERPPLHIFPEGTCVNNEYCVLFKRGAFDMGASVQPIAIKYNKVRGEELRVGWCLFESGWAVILFMTMQLKACCNVDVVLVATPTTTCGPLCCADLARCDALLPRCTDLCGRLLEQPSPGLHQPPAAAHDQLGAGV